MLGCMANYVAEEEPKEIGELYESSRTDVVVVVVVLVSSRTEAVVVVSFKTTIGGIEHRCNKNAVVIVVGAGVRRN